MLTDSMINREELSQCPVCKAISKDNLDFLFKNMKFRVTTYIKGDIIARQGDICKHLYLLVKGSVSTEMITESGGVLTIENIKAVRPFASAFLFAENNRFPVDVTSTEESTVVTIPKEEVISLFQKDAKFLESYIRYNADKTQFLSNKLQMVTIKTIRGKLANYLLEQLAKCHSISPKINTFYMDKNQTELSKYFGVTRPALARILGELQQEGVILAERNKITVLNRQALQNLLG